MAELGLAASIIGIAGAGAKLSLGLYQIAAVIGDAGVEVRQIATEVKGFSLVLRQFGTVVASDPEAPERIRSVAGDLYTACNKTLIETNALLDVLKPLIEQTGRRRQQWTLRIRWLFRRSRFALHQRSLESLKNTLELQVGIMNYEMATRERLSETITGDLRVYIEISMTAVNDDIREAQKELQNAPLLGNIKTLMLLPLGSMDSHLNAANPGDLAADESEGAGFPNGRLVSDTEHRRVSGNADSDNIVIENAIQANGALVNAERPPSNRGGNIDETDVSECLEDLDIGDVSQALVPFLEMRYLQEVILRLASDVLGRTQPEPVQPQPAWLSPAPKQASDRAALAKDSEVRQPRTAAEPAQQGSASMEHPAQDSSMTSPSEHRGPGAQGMITVKNVNGRSFGVPFNIARTSEGMHKILLKLNRGAAMGLNDEWERSREFYDAVQDDLQSRRYSLVMEPLGLVVLMDLWNDLAEPGMAVEVLFNNPTLSKEYWMREEPYQDFMPATQLLTGEQDSWGE